MRVTLLPVPGTTPDSKCVGDLDDLCVDIGEDPLDDNGEPRDDYDPGRDIWRSLPVSHKLASKTSSFSFVRDEHDTIMNIAKESTTPQVCSSLYLNNSWFGNTSLEEIGKDVADLPMSERQSVLSAWREHLAMIAAKSRGPKVRTPQ